VPRSTHIRVVALRGSAYAEHLRVTRRGRFNPTLVEIGVDRAQQGFGEALMLPDAGAEMTTLRRIPTRLPCVAVARLSTAFSGYGRFHTVYSFLGSAHAPLPPLPPLGSGGRKKAKLRRFGAGTPKFLSHGTNVEHIPGSCKLFRKIWVPPALPLREGRQTRSVFGEGCAARTPPRSATRFDFARCCGLIPQGEGGKETEHVDEQQGFRGGQPQIEIMQMWRTKRTPFPH
jgi:hypothetical protein